MGFGYFENALFEGELLRRIQPRAKVYIINVDGFFEKAETAPVKTILHDPKAPDEYEAKRFWQRVHERICGTFTAICGQQFVIFRSRDTGAYYMEGQPGSRKRCPFRTTRLPIRTLANASVATAVDFLSRFTQKKCVILTIVPNVGTQIGTAKAIASGVGLKLVTPEKRGRASDI